MNKTKVINGSTVELCHVDDYGLSADDGGKWLLICVAHGSIIQDTNKARLWQNANDVANWCETHNN
jgi:hypothetical protein